MKKYFWRCLLFFLSINSPLLIAQPFMHQVKSNSSEQINFFNLSDAFEAWSQTVDLKNTKGWKYYQRWEWENASRIKSDGSSDYMTNYMQAYTELNRKYAAPTSNSRSAIWSPEGPRQLAPTTNPVGNHGQGRINAVTFHPTDPNTLFACSSGGGIWKTTNGGNSWAPSSSGIPILRVSDLAIAPSNPNIMYVTTGDYERVAYQFPSSSFSHYGVGLYKSIDAGATWNPTNMSYQTINHPQSMIGNVFINPTNPDDILVSGFDGIQKSSNGGNTWTTTFDSLIWDIKQDPNDFNILYAGSGHVRNYQKGKAEIYKSLDFGATWTRIGGNTIPNQINSIVRIELAIAPSNSNYVYALVVDTSYGTHSVYQSMDAGATWNKKLDGDTLNLLGWYSGDPAFDSGGQGWYDLTLITDHNDPNKIFVGGVNMWGSADGGNTWGIVTYWVNYFAQSVHADHHQVRRNPLTNQYFVCSDGGIDRTDTLMIGDYDQGFLPTQWNNVSGTIANTEFYKIGLGNNTTQIIGGTQDNGTFLQDGNWQNWLHITGGDGMECMIDQQNESTLYSTLYYGILRRSNDGGQTFLGGLTDTIKNSNERGAWVTPFAMNAQNSSTIYTGFGNLWKSTTKGDSWEKLSPFDSIVGLGYPQRMRAIDVNPNDSLNIYIVRAPIWSFGLLPSVWVTRDEGTTWTDVSLGLPVTDVYLNDIAIGNSADSAWIVCGGIDQGKKVYQTSDGGNTWTNISGTLPNLPVNSIVYHPTHRVLYIGTDLGVYYRRANDTDWTLMGTDLPNVIVSELEIHYNTNKLYAATYGRGVWKTDLITPIISNTQQPSLYQVTCEVFPNPNKGNFTLKLEQVYLNQVNIEVVDILGQVIHQEQINIQDNHLQKTIDLDLVSGQYYLRIIHGNNSLIEKITVN